MNTEIETTEIQTTGQIVKKKIGVLIPYPDNPNDHSDNLELLIESIVAHGFYGAILITKNNRIICGHGRLKAVVELGMEEIPCIVMDVTDEQYYDIMLSDNKLTRLSKYKTKNHRIVLMLLEKLEHKPVAYGQEDIDKAFGRKNKEVGDGEANFGEGGIVKIETDEENAKLIKRKIFQLTPVQHEDVTAKLKAYIKEHKLDGEAQALIHILKGLNRAPRTIRKSGPAKDIEVENE